MSSAEVSLRLWQSLSPTEQAQVLALQIDAQQIEYAGTVERTVQTCTSSSAAEVAGLAVFLGKVVAGFLVLRRRSLLPAWAPVGSVVLAGMRVDLSHQGRGVGRAALGAVDTWLATNWPEASVLALSVDAGNAKGRAAYVRAGFAEFTRPQPGRIGTVHFMAKQLRQSTRAD